MLPVSWTTIRLFLHVTAATIWVGGQFTLAGLVPALRGISDDAPRTVARRFNRIAWPAFGVLVLTGIWNVIAVDPDFTGLGLGKALTLAGLASISDRGVTTGMLFVDESNTNAVGLYERLGFTTHRVDVAYRSER